MARDLLTEEKDQIKAEADEAFDNTDMGQALMDELADDSDAELAIEPGTEVDDAALGEALDDDAPAGDAEKPAAAAAEKPAAGVDRGDGRDVEGQFVKKQQDAANTASAAAKAAGKTDAEQKAAGDQAAKDVKAAAEKPAAAAAPQWSPFQVKADKALHPIDEAKVAEQGDYMVIAVPKKDFPTFQHRIGRGIAAERQKADIQARTRELEFQRTAPKPRSDAEIEADLLVKTLAERIHEVLEPHELENLKLRVQIAQKDEKTTFAERETARRADVESGEAWQRSQIETLTDQAFDLVENNPELKGMTPDQIRTVLAEFAIPMIDKLVFKENGETYANTEHLFKLMKRELLVSRGSAAPAPAGNPAPAKKTEDGERFNAGQDSAAKPASTSLKTQRHPAAPSPARPSRAPVPLSAQRDERQAAEDAARKSRRKMMSSATLDWDDDDDTT